MKNRHDRARADRIEKRVSGMDAHEPDEHGTRCGFGFGIGIGFGFGCLSSSRGWSSCGALAIASALTWPID
jgi:hypothetical protein